LSSVNATGELYSANLELLPRTVQSQ